RDNMDRFSGTPFNMGGGPRNSISLLELLRRMEELVGRKVLVRYEPARLADQRYYASDYTRFSEKTGWRPAVGVEEGIERLSSWLRRRPSKVRTDEKSAPSLQEGSAR